MRTQIAKFTGPKWGPPGSCRPRMGPMLAPWTLQFGYSTCQIGCTRLDSNLLGCDYIMISQCNTFPHNLNAPLLALWQSSDCPNSIDNWRNVSEVALKDIYKMYCHQPTTRHNKVWTVSITHGKRCVCNWQPWLLMHICTTTQIKKTFGSTLDIYRSATLASDLMSN